MAQSSPAYHRAYNAAHPKQAEERRRRWRVKNPDYQAEYRQKNREKIRANKRISEGKRRALKLGQFVENVNPTIVLIRDAGICGICGNPVDSDFHVDHVIPLSKGGMHGYENVQVAHSVCNVRKGNRV